MEGRHEPEPGTGAGHPRGGPGEPSRGLGNGLDALKLGADLGQQRLTLEPGLEVEPEQVRGAEVPA